MPPPFRNCSVKVPRSCISAEEEAKAYFVLSSLLKDSFTGIYGHQGASLTLRKKVVKLFPYYPFQGDCLKLFFGKAPNLFDCLLERLE